MFCYVFVCFCICFLCFFMFFMFFFNVFYVFLCLCFFMFFYVFDGRVGRRARRVDPAVGPVKTLNNTKELAEAMCFSRLWRPAHESSSSDSERVAAIHAAILAESCGPSLLSCWHGMMLLYVTSSCCFCVFVVLYYLFVICLFVVVFICVFDVV